MCVVYLEWESNIDMERLEKVLQWHSVTVEGSDIRQNKYSFAEIDSENLIRRNLCCFGRHWLVHYSPQSLEQHIEQLKIISSMTDVQRENLAKAEIIHEEYTKRWQLFDAEWWLACIRTLVDEFDTMGILYTFGKKLSDFSSVLSKPKHTVSVQELCVDTLLYLPEKTILEIKKSTVADNPAIP